MKTQPFGAAETVSDAELFADGGFQPEMQEYAENGLLPTLAEYIQGAKNPVLASLEWSLLAMNVQNVLAKGRARDYLNENNIAALSQSRVEIAVSMLVKYQRDGFGPLEAANDSEEDWVLAAS